jgi:hypothetical protein
MVYEWFRAAVETSVQLAFAVLPAAPLLGRRLPSIDIFLSGEKTGDVEGVAQVSLLRPGFCVSSALVGADENEWWNALSQVGCGGSGRAAGE